MRCVWGAASLGLLVGCVCTDRESEPAPPLEDAPQVEQAPAPAERPAISFGYDEALAKRLVRKHDSWADGCARHPHERIGLGGVLHWESSARPVPLDLSDDLVRVMEGLPRPFFELFERHVCAVVLMHGAPMTGTLSTLAADRTRSIILLDVDKLQLLPNAWLAFKESSAFAEQADTEISGTLADPIDNTRRVLMHTELRGRPWQLQVRRKGKLVRQLSACWAQRRCRAKRDILEELLRRWSPP